MHSPSIPQVLSGEKLRPADRLFVLGSMLLVQKRYKEALAVLAEVGKIEPQYPLLQNRIIFAHLQLRDYTTALELAEGLVDDLPGDADAWRLLARAASGLGQRSNQGECLAGFHKASRGGRVLFNE